MLLATGRALRFLDVAGAATHGFVDGQLGVGTVLARWEAHKLHTDALRLFDEPRRQRIEIADEHVRVHAAIDEKGRSAVGGHDALAILEPAPVVAGIFVLTVEEDDGRHTLRLVAGASVETRRRRP